MSRLATIICLLLCLAAPLALLASAAEPVTVCAVGDVMLGGTATGLLQRTGYAYPFAATSHLLRQADITVGNLEAPLTRRGEEFRDKRFRFRVPPQAALAMRQAGFSVLTLANNHILDYGPTGLSDTLTALEQAGILSTGAGHDLAGARTPAIVTVRGQRIAFLAYSCTLPAEFYAAGDRPGTAPGLPALVTRDVRTARTQADYVLVSLHWGGEGLATPRRYQQELGRAAIDSGASAVIGHHPHVLQGVERYRDGVILYSLGNFTFGSRSRTATSSVIAQLRLVAGRCELSLVPLDVSYARTRYQPRPLVEAGASGVISEMEQLSLPWGSSFARQGDAFVLVPPVLARR